MTHLISFTGKRKYVLHFLLFLSIFSLSITTPNFSSGKDLYANEISKIDYALSQGKLERAAILLEEHLSKNPNDVQAKFKLATLLARQGKELDAIDIFQNLINLFPELPEPYNNLAVIFAKRGEIQKARLLLVQVVNIHPHYLLAINNLKNIDSAIKSTFYQKKIDAKE